MRTSVTANILRVLLLFIAVVAILYYGSTFLVPLAFGAFLAAVFQPLSSRLQKVGLPKWATITLSVLIFVLVFLGIVTLLTLQTRSLVQDWPKIEKRLQEQQDNIEEYLIQNVGFVSEDRIQQMKDRLAKQRERVLSTVQGFAGSFVAFLSGLVLTLVYMVFIMLERERLVNFVVKLTPANQEKSTREALTDARKAASQYLVGRFTLIGILAAFYIVGFLIFGLSYAVPLGVLVALLSIIPYIGNVLGAVFVVAIAMATGADTTTLLGCIGTMVVAQVLESNVLTPWIMSKEVSLNPLTTFAGIIGFSIIWGIAGTILAIPIIGALKKIFDHVEALRPIGYVMGTDKE